MYWKTTVRTKSGNTLGVPFEGTCGVRQGDPLSPLLFGLFIDRFEQFLDRRCPGEGVELGGRLLRMLLYADDMVLLSPNLHGLQRMLDVLHMFCADTHMKVNVDKTEVVVFGPKAFGGNTTCLYDGKPITVSTSFKYLGVVFHSTRGMNVVVEQLTGAGRRAIWAMHGRCKTRGIVDISLRLRLFRILCEPVLCYCAEVWAPGELSSFSAALKSPLQVLQNDYVRYISGLRRNTPTDVLCKEFCMQPLARSWLRACVQQWNRMATCDDSWLARAFVGDLQLAHSLGLTLDTPDLRRAGQAQRTWGGSMLRVLHWLSSNPACAQASALRTQVLHVLNTLAQDPATLHGNRRDLAIETEAAMGAWDSATQQRWSRALAGGGAVCDYATHSLMRSEDEFEEEGFPPDMPHYVRHTGRYNLAHTRSLARIRCCSSPLAGCSNQFLSPHPYCVKCAPQPGQHPPIENVAHFLLQCPLYSSIRADPRFQPLFSPDHSGNIHDFLNQPKQYRLAEFVHTCLQRRAEAPNLWPPSSTPRLHLAVRCVFVLLFLVIMLGIVWFLPATKVHPALSFLPVSL